MPGTDQKPVFAFVWRPQENVKPVVDMAQSTGSCAIFDVSSAQKAQVSSWIKGSGAPDVKLALDYFMNPELDGVLEETKIENLWIEYHPWLTNYRLDVFLNRLKELKATCSCIPIIGDIDTLIRIFESEDPPQVVAIKGAEASGFVGTETTGILYSASRHILKQQAHPPVLIIWGGIATAEAAAAFLCSGAGGVVFESLHWQTDMVETDENLRQRVAKLRPDHSRVIGQRLGVPCRLFDKGNSKSVKEIEYYASSLCNGEVTDQDRLAFVQRVVDTAKHALESILGNNDTIPLGPEAAFAESFARRFGRSTIRALEGFIEEVERLCSEAPQIEDRFLNSPAVQKLGTRFPFIQGAMSWITDVPTFALAVAEAGGLPTIALGMKSKKQLEQDLGAIGKLMGARPYAVNAITLAENPFRDEQLDWIEETHPPFVVIAAGDPSYAARFREKNMEVIYIAPDEGLIRMALEAGVNYVVLEGNEAGGHVGEHSTLTLAQIGLDLKKREPGLFEGRYIILAGGIFNRETAFRAAMLGADAVQMGTAYLATKEIVESGALSPLYQHMILESTPGTTTISGESIGLRVRSLKSPKIESICALEREWVAGTGDEADFRHRLESMSAGSLLVAARGLSQPSGQSLDRETCIKEGQFMSGASAGNIDRGYTVAELHRELVQGAFEPSFPEPTYFKTPAVLRTGGSSANGNRCAVTGMALVNSLGNSQQEIWNACLEMKSGIIEIPSSKWDHSVFYDPDPRAPGKTYCKVGAFRNIEISRKELGIPPQDFLTMTSSTKLTMWLAQQVVTDSNILGSNIPRERIGVLISQNSGEVASTIKDIFYQIEIHDILRAVRNVIQMTPEKEKAVAEAILAGRLAIDDTTLLGRLNCTAAGFICNKYGFLGPSYSVTAACATSLAALYSAIQLIKNNIIDAAIVGGGEELLEPAHYLEFSAIGALTGLSGVQRPPHESSRPFDATRDGMVMGEGGAMIVIERESVAKARGARIHAYITGIGASNSDRGMVESLAQTQELAFRAAFKDAGYGPDHVDLVECHATSTAQGDVEEVKALKSMFPADKRTMLTSFKSQIGHTLGASGLNNLIRGICAMQSGIYPATLNFRIPDPDMRLEDCGFVIPTQPADWPQSPEQPRRAIVNAFGFGGANYVVQMEASRNHSGAVMVSPPSAKESLIKSSPVKAEDATGMEGIFFMEACIAGRPHRLGVLADNKTDAQTKVADLISTKKEPTFSPKDLRVLARHGIFAAPSDEAPPPLAFVFSGQGSQYSGMGKYLYDGFPSIRNQLDRIAAIADFDLLDIIFNAPEEDIKKTRWQQPALFALEYTIASHLMSLGMVPLAMAGHSVGEITALCVAGVYSWDDGFRLVNKRAQCMDKAGGLSTDPGTMIAADAPKAVLEKKVSENRNVFFTNFNSPHQVVLGGSTREVLDLMQDLKQAGYRATRLNVSMAFHSPAMKVIREELEEFIADIEFHPPIIPVISNTTMEPFPADPMAIKKIVADHLESPVRWMQNVRTLWDDYAIRLFLEVGPRDALCNLIVENVHEAQCIQTCMPDDEIRAFRSMKARLFSLGHLRPENPPVRPVISTPLDDNRPQPMGSENGAVAAIVDREINAFMMETFGKFLKPKILNAIHREVDPSFSEERLEQLFRAGVDSGTPAPVPRKIQPAALPPTAPIPPSSTQASPAVPRPQASPAASAEVDHVEEVIRIIMDATGYERDEIEPDMDIRQDLAIRSSRLPVIMDSAERRFGITIILEDFVGVRTIQDMADRILEVMVRDGVTSPSGPPATGTPLAQPAAMPPSPGEKTTSTEREPLERSVLSEVPVEKTSINRLKLKPGQEVVVMSLGRNSSLATETADIFRNEFRAHPLHMDILNQGAERNGFDLRTPDGAEKATLYLASIQSLAGLVLVLDDGDDLELDDMQEVASLVTGFFRSFKSLMRSSAKQFCMLLFREPATSQWSSVTAEGILGIFLAAAQEYSSVLFRSVALDTETDIKNAIDKSLDRDTDVVQMLYHGQRPFTLQIGNQPVSISHETPITISPGHVLVVSGGGRGITAQLALALAPFKPRLVLLGSSELDPEIDYESLISSANPEDETSHRLIQKRNPHMAGDKLEKKVSQVHAGAEITGTLKQLSQDGVEAVYYACDVSDPVKVKEVVGRVVEHYGRIDGIIHGAGVIRDAFIEFMTPDDFSKVMDVKFLGAWNLCQAARSHGLHFFVGLSSIVAVTGNAGQANYCAASRAMAAMVRVMQKDLGLLPAKALMLPPIEGTGMADDPEIKELMKLRDMDSAYVHVKELAGLFLREISLGPSDASWVIPYRALPHVKTVKQDLTGPVFEKGTLSSAGIVFKPNELPMIQAISRLDLEKCTLDAQRTFSLNYDLWLEDHKPLEFPKHPLVSGIMAVETFLEAAHLLYPHLNVLGIQNMVYQDIIECPPGQDREARINCRHIETSRGCVICGLSLSCRDISPSGRSLGTWSDNYQGQVILGCQGQTLSDQPDLAVGLDELDTPPVEHDEITQWYEMGTALVNRYQVIRRLDGTGPGIIKGSTVYEESHDFAGLEGAVYQHPPYLLEALMHIVAMYALNRNKDETRKLIPGGIGEMRYSRLCRSGENIALEARLKSENADSLTWDAQAKDDMGTTIMRVNNLVMKWFSA